MAEYISPTAAAAISGSLVKGAAARVARSPTPMPGDPRLVGAFQQRTPLELFPAPIKCCAICGEGVKRIPQGIFCSHSDCPRSVWAHKHCLGKAEGRPTKADLARRLVILEQDELPEDWPEGQGTSLLQAIAFKCNIGLQRGDGSGHNTDGLFDERQIRALEAELAVAAKIVPIGLESPNGGDLTLHLVCTHIDREGQLMFSCSRTCQQASQAFSSSSPAAPRGAFTSPTVETKDSRSDQGLAGTGDLEGLPVRDSIRAAMVEQDRRRRVVESSLTLSLTLGAIIRDKGVSSHITDGVQMISLGG